MGAFDDLHIFSVPDQFARQLSWRHDVRELVEPENVVSCELRIYLELLLENSDQLIDDLHGEDKLQMSLYCSLKDNSLIAVIEEGRD